jgi:tetratricopeptide (TPR) repeat protein
MTLSRTGSAVFALAALLCLGLIAAAYAGFFANAFHFDDVHVLVNNLFLRDLGNSGLFFTDARTGSSLPLNAAYRPLVTLSLALDYHRAGGLRPEPFHATQLALLSLLWLALVDFYRRVLDLCQPEPGNRWLALFGATWFAVHTVNTETMNLMHARSEILSALGVVAGFLVYLASPRLRRLHLYLVPVALGALAKPPAVLFGPLLFVLELLARRWAPPPPPPDTGREPAPRAAWGRAVRAAAMAAVPATLAGAALFVFVDRMGAPTQTYGGGGRFHYALTQVWTWVHYLRLFVLPHGLSADTDLKLLSDASDTRVFAGLLILGGLAVIVWRCAHSRRAWPVAFGVAWFALTLAPTSSVLPLAEPLNEHRIFLPFIGLILAVVWGARLAWEAAAARFRAARGVPGRVFPVALCLFILAAHALGTYSRNEVWRTGESLWKDVTGKSPGNGRGWMNYGVALMARGDLAGARACFERALPLLPSYSTLQINLGVVHAALGDQEAAARYFARALELAPGQPESHYFYARWLVDRGRGPEALEHLDSAIRLAPGFETAHALRRSLLAARGDSGAAAPLPAGADATALFRTGAALGSRERFLESALTYRASLALDPQSADTLNNLGWTLGKLGFFPQAVPLLEEAVRLRPGFALARNNLAWVKSRLPG